MIDILVISQNRIIFDEINLAFSALTHNFEYVTSGELAVDHLDSESPDFIFLIHKEFSEIVKILEKLSGTEVEDNVPVICFTELLSPEDRSVLYGAGAFDVISLPILKEELIMLIKKYSSSFGEESKEISAGMQGRLEDFGFIDLMQTMEEGEKSAILTIKKNNATGKILFQKGQIYAADYRKFSGMSAILNIVGWLRGEFLIEFTEQEFEKKIELNNQQIIMEAFQRIDARSGFLKQLPPIDNILLISPETDIFKLSDSDFRYIKFFQGGNTIYNYLNNFDLDELKLLEKVLGFYNKKILLTREQFDAYKTEYEADVEKKGFKGVFKKLLKKDDKLKHKPKQSEVMGSDKTRITDPNSEKKVIESVVSIDPQMLVKFKEKITEL